MEKKQSSLTISIPKSRAEFGEWCRETLATPFFIDTVLIHPELFEDLCSYSVRKPPPIFNRKARRKKRKSNELS
jgi:hypothetical protein